jgi:hypothetical protein
MSLVLGAVVSTANADPIGASYNVTDLGSGTITLSTSNGTVVPIDPTTSWFGLIGSATSTATNADQFTTVSNGQATYPFILTPATTLTPNQGIMTDFPMPQAAPVAAAGGNPINAYSVISTALSNANGIAVAINSAGINGHYGEDFAYYVQRNSNGSWGAPVVIWGGGVQLGQGPVGGVTIAGINSMNQVLGTMAITPSGVTNAVLYNIGTQSLTNLSTLLLQNNFVASSVRPIAIDDLGQILVQAAPFGGSSVQGVQTLLLTPVGMPGDPVPAPEPGSLAVMALAVAAFAATRIRESRRRS